MEEGEKPQLELIVKVININYNENKEQLSKNEDLKGYAIFVAKVQDFINEGFTLEEAIKRAADECIREGVLVEFLTEYKYGELINMFKLYYDEELAKEAAREEGFEEGIESLIKQMLKMGKTAEEIAAYTGIPLIDIIRIREKMLVEA
jgi:hypothetical protein